jgi:hypothetical protein
LGPRVGRLCLSATEFSKTNKQGAGPPKGIELLEVSILRRQRRKASPDEPPERTKCGLVESTLPDLLRPTIRVPLRSAVCFEFQAVAHILI